MEFDFTHIIEAVIALLSAVVTGIIVPVLKERLTCTRQEHLQFWVETAVKAAEQLYGSKTGQQKKEYVVSFLLSKGIVFDIDEVSAMIESAVYNLIKTPQKEACSAETD